MTRLEELILFILDRAHKAGKKDLSMFQVFKLPYMMEVVSLKYAGIFFVPDITFLRDKNGPISVDIYKAVESLKGKGYIKVDVTENKKYGHPRYSHKLAKKLPKLKFTDAEIIFLDNFLSKLLPLSQERLKRLVYSTEPMEEIRKEEKGGKINKGAVIDLDSVRVDPDIVDTYSDSE